MFRLMVVLATLAMTGTTLLADRLQTTPRVVDARMLLRSNGKAQELAQVSGFLRTFDLQHDVARDIFGAAPAALELTNVELPGSVDATLDLVRSRDVFDPTTQFFTMTKQGKRAFTVRPITSYAGTVRGVPGSRVSLHYSEGDLTGVIEDPSGRRVVLTHDANSPSRAKSTPHILADENAAYNGNIMSKFLCGNESIVDDPDQLGKLMSVRASKPIEALQDDDMRELKLAVVLREDLDSAMKRRGLTDEQVAQYFMKIVACVSQAYEEEFNTTIFVPYFQKFTEDEPSPYFNNGREPGELLQEFSRDWAQNYSDVKRDAAHLFTLIRPIGGSYVGGIAFLGKLCDKARFGGYGVSTVWTNAKEMPGRPTVSNGFVWDYFVIAHELGHNVGSPHTHNCFWTPKPVDTCQLQEDNTDACFSRGQVNRVVRPGTIMSYCHLANGESTPFLFGARVSEKMRGWVEQSCLTRPNTPVLRITYPRGIEEWNAGSKINIKWAAYRVSRMRLEMSTDEGKNWSSIAASVNAVDRNYEWTLPAVTASRVWIRAVDNDGSGAADTTLAPHSIVSPLTLTEPKGGERIGQGSAVTIKWIRQPFITAVNLEFAPNGDDWTSLATNVTATTFDWTAPSITTEKARIRVSSSSNPSIVSVGGEFAIGAPRFELVIPEPGATICSNQNNQYRWNGDFIDRVRIQYSTDAGATWRTATQAASVDVVDWQIFSRAGSLGSIPDNTPCVVRVINNATSEELDRVENLTIKQCDAPVSVQEGGDVPTDVHIRMITPNPARTEATLTLAADRQMTVDVELVSVDGSVTQLQQGITVDAGSDSRIALALDAVASGVYQLVVRSGSTRIAVPFTVVR